MHWQSAVTATHTLSGARYGASPSLHAQRCQALTLHTLATAAAAAARRPPPASPSLVAAIRTRSPRFHPPSAGPRHVIPPGAPTIGRERERRGLYDQSPSSSTAPAQAVWPSPRARQPDCAPPCCSMGSLSLLSTRPHAHPPLCSRSAPNALFSNPDAGPSTARKHCTTGEGRHIALAASHVPVVISLLLDLLGTRVG